MNRNETALSIGGDIRLAAVSAGMTLAWSFISAMLAVLVIVSTSGIFSGHAGFVPQYDLLVLGICLAVAVSIALPSGMVFTAAGNRVSAAWSKLYLGTEWWTPAGEAGLVIGVGSDASTLELAFPDGQSQRYAIQHLRATDRGDHSDTTGLRRDMVPDWDFFEGMQSPLLTVAVSVWTVLAGLSLFMTMSPVIGAQAFLPLLMLDFFAVLCPATVMMLAGFSASDTSTYTSAMSKTKWRCSDGRVGLVRWAERKLVGENRYDEKMVLSFPDGLVETFSRQAVKPVSAFENHGAESFVPSVMTV